MKLITKLAGFYFLNIPPKRKRQRRQYSSSPQSLREWENIGNLCLISYTWTSINPILSYPIPPPSFLLLLLLFFFNFFGPFLGLYLLNTNTVILIQYLLIMPWLVHTSQVGKSMNEPNTRSRQRHSLLIFILPNPSLLAVDDNKHQQIQRSQHLLMIFTYTDKAYYQS